MVDPKLTIEEVEKILDNLSNPNAEAGLDDLAWLLTKVDNIKQVGWNVQGKVKIDEYSQVKDMIEDWHNSTCIMLGCRNKFMPSDFQRYCIEHRP